MRLYIERGFTVARRKRASTPSLRAGATLTPKGTSAVNALVAGGAAAASLAETVTLSRRSTLWEISVPEDMPVLGTAGWILFPAISHSDHLPSSRRASVTNRRSSCMEFGPVLDKASFIQEDSRPDQLLHPNRFQREGHHGCHIAAHFCLGRARCVTQRNEVELDSFCP
jgi:hypothetical protein